jgi:hypothetical protein
MSKNSGKVAACGLALTIFLCARTEGQVLELTPEQIKQINQVWGDSKTTGSLKATCAHRSGGSQSQRRPRAWRA